MAQQSLILALSLAAGTSAGTWAVAHRVQPRHPGLAAFLLAAHAVVLLNAAPMLADLCDSVLAVQSWTCVLACQGFKLLALALRRGVLANELAAGCSFRRFAGALLLPVIPTNTGQAPPKHTSARVVGKLQLSTLKLATFAVITLAGMHLMYGSPGGAASADEAQEQTQRAATTTAMPPWAGTLLAMCLRPMLYTLSGVALWLEVDGMGDLVDALALGICGIEAEPHFAFPFAADSLNNFWGKRWNLTISALLRPLTFWPVCEGRLVAPDWRSARNDGKSTSTGSGDGDGSMRSSGSGSGTTESVTGSAAGGAASGAGLEGSSEGMAKAPAASAAGGADEGVKSDCAAATTGAVAAGEAATVVPTKRASTLRKMLGSTAAFGASGLWHELVFAQMTGGFTTRGVWTFYFVIQAPCIAVEATMRKKLARSGTKVPSWLSVLAFNVVLLTMVSLWWVPPMTWRLPDACAADGAPAISMFERIMQQGWRDVRGLAQLLTACGTLLAGSSGGALPWLTEGGGRPAGSRALAALAGGWSEWYAALSRALSGVAQLASGPMVAAA